MWDIPEDNAVKTSRYQQEPEGLNADRDRFLLYTHLPLDGTNSTPLTFDPAF